MSSDRRPLVSCSPWALLIIVLFLAGWYGWKLVRPYFPGVNDPNAVPRAVTARGDLAGDEKATIELFDVASPSVVHITTFERGYGYDRFRLRPMDVPQGTGSGFVWDERGYIITNFHVIKDASKFFVTLEDNSVWQASLVGRAEDFDVAVLQIDAPRAKQPPIAIGSSKDLKVGQKVFAIGNPFGLDHTLTTGIISALDREIMSVTRHPIKGVIQTDAAINPGNSGGPLLDSAGRLIGMNTAIYTPEGTGGSVGIGFAIPVDTINSVVPQLIRMGKVEPPILGVTPAPDQVARMLGAKGFVVDSVAPGSGAERAGLRSMESSGSDHVRADVITAIDGTPVSRIEEVREILMNYRPGDKVKVDLVRDAKKLTLEVTLQARE